MPVRPLGIALWAVLLGVGAAIAGSDAMAQSALPPPVLTCAVGAPQPCMVVTRGGATFVGQLTAITPDDQLYLRLATQEERVIPMADVISAIPTAPPQRAGLVNLQQAPVSASLEGLQPPMRIEQRPLGLPSEAPWGVVCQAPCPAPSLNLYRGYSYRLFDPGGPGSPEFSLPERVQAVALRVRHGNLGRRRGGLALLIIGSVVTAVALPAAYLYFPTHSTLSSEQTLTGQIAIGGLAGLGLPALVAGIGLYVVSSNRVDLTPLRGYGD